MTETEPIFLTDDYMRGQLARHIPGGYCSDRKWWLDTEDISPRTAALALRLFPELSIDHPWLAELRDELLRSVRPWDYATPHGHRITAPRVHEASGFTLHDYQSVDGGFVMDVLDAHGGAYIGWEMGLGKTLATCAIIDEWQCHFNLIVCSNSAKDVVWAPELQRCVPWVETVVMGNTPKKRAAAIERVLELMDREEPVNLVVHYEALALIAGKTKQAQESYEGKNGQTRVRWVDVDKDFIPEDGMKTRMQLGDGWNQFGTWDITVCDEVHRIKNPDAQMTRALKKIPTVGRLGLSGSIIENHLEELWSPLHWLHPKVYSAKWRTWNDRYLDYVDGPHGKLCLGPKEEAIPKLRKELGKFMVYRRSHDELDIPQAHVRDILVDLSPGQRRIYDDLAHDLVATLPDGTHLTVEDGLPLLAKLRQIATGLDLLGEVADSTKLDLAEELIADNEDAVFVVFSWYKAGLDALAKRLGEDTCFVVHGDVTMKQRAERIKAFMAGERRVLLATIATLSESVNLQRASAVIMLDRDWNPKRNEQAVARVVRQGQKRHVAVTNIIARNTVDELKVNPTIANKEALSRLILGK